MSKEKEVSVLVPEWNDVDANRLLYPDDFDENGKEKKYLYPISFTGAERRRLFYLGESSGFRTANLYVKNRIFGG